ncbi:MAG: delta-60 repeat domain-containing protein, partial [Gemmatimonadota bacterium]|nr:delta-60 repeat domain-containing protein [Gemmatimonadota bacterium]
ATFVAQSAGTVTVWMSPLSSNSTDPNLANNRHTDEVTVNAGGLTIAFGDVLEDVTTTPGDTTWYSFQGVPGEFARVQVWITQDLGHSIQLVIENPLGGEIFPDGIPRGKATDNSSAYHVFQMGDMDDNIWRIGLKTFGTGPYRLGLGTGAGRMDLSYSTEGTGVAYGPNSSAADPFFDWDWVGDEITVVGEEEMVRFDGNGDLIGSFGVGGVVDLSVLGAGRWGQAVGVQPDGKIVVAARQTISPYPWIIARFDATGALDPTFGTGGITEVLMGVDFNSKPLGIGFQQNGADLDIVIGGDAGDPPERVGIVRLKPDGSVDTGFGVGGTVMEARFMTPRKMALQSDGSILIHGWDDLLRYSPDGVLDTSFGVNGIVDYAIPGNAFGIDVLPDDRLIVTGADIGRTFVMRLTADGARDATFAGGGYQTYDFGFNNERFQAATPDGTGGLIAVGYQRVAGGDYEWLVSRMSFDGVLDRDFAIAGYLTEIRVDNPLAVAIDSAGRIVVGGQAEGTLRGIELTRHIPN